MASRFRISPWVVALAIVACILAYVVYRYWFSSVETFITTAECQANYSTCLANELPGPLCQANLNACLSGATAPPAPALIPAPAGPCQLNYNTCVTSGLPEPVCKTNLNSCTPPAPAPAPAPSVVPVAPAPSVVPVAPAPAPSVVPVAPAPAPTPSQINPAILTGPTPSAAQISAAQNNYWIDSSGERHLLETNFHRYTPSKTIVTPTYIPQAPLPTYTASSPTDMHSGVHSILSGAPLTPSLRQMIRNDVAGAVKDEFGQLQNQYQIQYMYQ